MKTIENIIADDLDDLVITAAERLASNTNNDGRKAQLDFLITTCGWTEQEILNELNFEVNTKEKYD